MNDILKNNFPSQSARHLARIVFLFFLLTFIGARIIVFLIMSQIIPDIYLYLGDTHFHHLNLGIFLLSGIGAYLLFWQPSARAVEIIAALYAVGLALTFDEFGMWLHLGGSYWQRASFDAVTVVAGLLGLLAFAPPLRSFRPKNWWVTILTLAVVLLFFAMLVDSFRFAGEKLGPKLKQMEMRGPR